ncbi:MAG TPA: hypothetical protein PLW93_06345, partial [Candidatus Absconditabacterales bacterium]|nr:hypothetical protein [Candidatus Absconditabacterales bacterium]
VTKWLKEHLSKVELLFKNHKDLVEATTVHFDNNDTVVGVSNKTLGTTVYHENTAFKIIIRELLRQNEVARLEEELALQQNLDDLFEKQESIIAASDTPPADKIAGFSNTNVKLSDQVFDKVMTLLLFGKSGGYLDESILKDIDEELEKLR